MNRDIPRPRYVGVPPEPPSTGRESRPPVRLAEAVAEANRRAAALGWPVVLELDPAVAGEVVVRCLADVGAARADAPSRVACASAEPDALVVVLLGEVRRRGWDRLPAPTLRSARASVWCDPP